MKNTIFFSGGFSNRIYIDFGVDLGRFLKIFDGLFAASEKLKNARIPLVFVGF